MAQEDIAANVAEPLPRIPTPVIVDLGSKSRKAIKRLKNGKGKLMADVDRAIGEAHSRLPDDQKNKQIIPVLVIYRKKRKRSKRGVFPFFPPSPFNLFR
jgi:hypothetical protein